MSYANRQCDRVVDCVLAHVALVHDTRSNNLRIQHDFRMHLSPAITANKQ